MPYASGGSYCEMSPRRRFFRLVRGPSVRFFFRVTNFSGRSRFSYSINFLARDVGKYSVTSKRLLMHYNIVCDISAVCAVTCTLYCEASLIGHSDIIIKQL